MDPVVTLEQAKLHLRITSTEADDDIEAKLNQANALVMDYLKEGADETWTDENAPLLVQAAVLEQLDELWRFRGDDEELAGAAPPPADGYLSPRIARLLHRLRPITLA